MDGPTDGPTNGCMDGPGRTHGLTIGFKVLSRNLYVVNFCYYHDAEQDPLLVTGFHLSFAVLTWFWQMLFTHFTSRVTHVK